jgi:hypothetical protein
MLSGSRNTRTAYGKGSVRSVMPECGTPCRSRLVPTGLDNDRLAVVLDFFQERLPPDLRGLLFSERGFVNQPGPVGHPNRLRHSAMRRSVSAWTSSAIWRISSRLRPASAASRRASSSSSALRVGIRARSSLVGCRHTRVSSHPVRHRRPRSRLTAASSASRRLSISRVSTNCRSIHSPYRMTRAASGASRP